MEQHGIIQPFGLVIGAPRFGEEPFPLGRELEARKPPSQVSSGAGKGSLATAVSTPSLGA
jgi:hypothetical protein